MDIEQIAELCTRLEQEIGRVVIGQQQTVRLLFTALLARGHVLLEGVPGTAKTLLARTFSACLEMQFGRIQFTPDLMPGDVVGTNLFNFQSNEFALTRGPIFTEFLLADEINRTPPKTQSALLEAMQEGSVTIDGTRHALSERFIVVATMNPIEQEGTYPLPEAQLDRFLFKIVMGYPERQDERTMVELHGHQSVMLDLGALDLRAICGKQLIDAARQAVARLRLSEPMLDYIVDLVRATRDNPSLLFGGSPRSTNMLAISIRAVAAMNGRDYVIPDDVKFLFSVVMRHRVVLAPGAEVEGLTADQVLNQIIEQVPAPR